MREKDVIGGEDDEAVVADLKERRDIERWRMEIYP